MIKLLTYNILARPYTHYVAHFHKSQSGDKYESISQTRRRYELASLEILRENAEIVALQEVEEDFIFREPAADGSQQLNPRVDELRQRYDVVSTSFKRRELRTPTDTDSEFDAERNAAGTALLLSKQSTLRINRCSVVGGSDETGGKSKSALIAELSESGGSATFIVVCCHFAVAKKLGCRDRHIQLIEHELHENYTTNFDNVVVCGDFNCRPFELTQLIAGPVFNQLVRVDCDLSTSCGAEFDYTSTIDHVFVGSALRALSCVVERPPSSPYEITDSFEAPANIAGASDHAWVLVELARRTPNDSSSSNSSSSNSASATSTTSVTASYRFNEPVSPMAVRSREPSSTMGFRRGDSPGYRGQRRGFGAFRERAGGGRGGFRRPYRDNNANNNGFRQTTD